MPAQAGLGLAIQDQPESGGIGGQFPSPLHPTAQHKKLNV